LVDDLGHLAFSILGFFAIHLGMAPTYRVLVLVLAFCGIRWGEVTGLKVKRLELMRKRLTVAETLSEVNGRLVWGTPKNHAARSVPIPPFLVDMLAEVVNGVSPEALVFTTWCGKPLRNLNFRRDVFDKPPRMLDSPGSPRMS
jgi:integrase